MGNERLSEEQRNEKLKSWSRDQRAQQFRKLPATPELMRQLFVFLHGELQGRGCDHSRRITEEWISANGESEEAFLAWLDDNAGFCDCEVLMNAEERFEEALRGKPTGL